MQAAEADFGVLRWILQAEQDQGGPLPIDSLIAMSCLREQRRLSADDLASAIQKSRAEAKATFERLVEAGFVEAHGRTKARTYTLAREVYAKGGNEAAYTRQLGFGGLQSEQMVLGHVRAHGSIKRKDVIQLCRVSGDQASRLLKRLVDRGDLVMQGSRRWATYRLPGSTT